MELLGARWISLGFPEHLEEAIRLESLFRIHLEQPAQVGTRNYVNDIQPLLSPYLVVFIQNRGVSLFLVDASEAVIEPTNIDDPSSKAQAAAIRMVSIKTSTS